MIAEGKGVMLAKIVELTLTALSGAVGSIAKRDLGRILWL
jgi:hypothetical protein